MTFKDSIHPQNSILIIFNIYFPLFFRSSTKSSGNYGLGDIVSSLQWIKRNIQHFGGHPGQVTILARGSGATLVTALTGSAMSKDLFKQAWVTNGAGAFENKTLAQASTENKKILEALNCGSDEVKFF